MAVINLGRVGYVHKGAYAAATTYQKYDVVLYNHGSYLYIGDTASQGHAPTETAYWQAMLDPSAMQEATEAAVNAADAAHASAMELAGQVDRLTTPFSITGDMVNCHPVSDYPLGVISHIAPVQAGSGDPSPSNVRPISGWTGAKLTRTGENDPNGTQFTAQFGQTVYGGEFNWKTGVLLSNKALIDLGDYEWVRDSNYPVFRTAAYLQDIFVNTTVISTHYTSYGLDLVDVIDNNNSVCVIGGYIWLRDDRYTDAAALKAALKGVMMLAELVTPEEIQLTPQQILSLSGENNLWSDCGETTVNGPNSPKVMEKRIAALEAAVLNV